MQVNSSGSRAWPAPARFGASLGKRPEWAPAVPALLAADNPKWRGTAHGPARRRRGGRRAHSLRTAEASSSDAGAHDLAVPLPGTPGPDDVLRFVLVSPVDADKSETQQRLGRFHQLNRGVHVAVVFLLLERDGESGMASFQRLQFACVHLRWPFPLCTSESKGYSFRLPLHRRRGLAN